MFTNKKRLEEFKELKVGANLNDTTTSGWYTVEAPTYSASFTSDGVTTYTSGDTNVIKSGKWKIFVISAPTLKSATQIASRADKASTEMYFRNNFGDGWSTWTLFAAANDSKASISAGDLTSNGKLTVEGTSTLKGDTTLSKTLKVTGNTTLGTTSTGALTAASATVTGALGVSGQSNLGTLTAGSSTLNSLGVTNAATVGGTLGVTGKTTLNELAAGKSTLGALSASGLNISGATQLGATGGSNTTTVNGDLTVTGTINGTASSAGVNIGNFNIIHNIIRKNNSDTYFELKGDIDDSTGARLMLFSTGYSADSSRSGSFELISRSINSQYRLRGMPDGSLTWSELDVAILYNTAEAHNSIYRGKDLTSYFNSGEMSTNIANGTFKDIYPGDYIIKSVTINGTTYTDVKWIVMDLDYHLHAGDSETTTHHLVLMPETILGTRQMNATNTTEGGYLSSAMWTTHIPLAVTGIEAAFGASHVLSHRELLTNAMDTNQRSKAYYGWSGAASNWTWTTVKVNLCNENMVYGAPIMSSSAYDTGECIKQLAAFFHNHGLRCSKRQWWWLRAVSHSPFFADVGADGIAYTGYASYSGGGFRPYFLLR